MCVGKLRPPFADDVAHYERLLRPQARLETVELSEGDALLKRIPERAFVSVLDRTGEEMSSERFAGWIEERRQAGRELWFAIGGAFGLDPAVLARSDHRLSLGAADPAAPAGTRRAARAALPRSQDHQRRAVPLLSLDPQSNEPLGRLRAELAAAAARLREPDGEPDAVVERPPRPEFGDYSTNLALLLAPAMKSPPREVAERIGEDLQERLAGVLDRAEVAGPGFLNLFLSDAWFRAALADICAQGDGFGAGAIPEDARERILVEFVSANPTGPLTAAGGRHAAYGDSLSRVLEFAGHAIEREYYVNDYGTQVQRFGESIAARMTGTEVPEGGYEGDYVREIAEQARAEAIDPGDIDALARRGIELMLERVRATLERFRVRFDRFYSERALHDSGAVERELDKLAAGEHVYDSDGATWLRTSAFEDDKDRVLRRSSGEMTYFGTDIAYHQDKRRRGYDRLINLLGADHHGYLGRMMALFEVLGDPGKLEIVIMQLVQVVERGERSQMSKRRGEFVTLDELVDDIGVDAARFFMLQRSPDTTARPRPGPRARAQPGEPGLLRPVRARADREHPAQRRRGAIGGG